jgi:hypothetical protein
MAAEAADPVKIDDFEPPEGEVLEVDPRRVDAAPVVSRAERGTSAAGTRRASPSA